MQNCLFCRKEIPDESQYCCFCGRKQTRSTARKANGTGSIYQRGKTYTAKHRTFRNGRCIAITKGGFKTKREAQQWLNNNSVLDVRAKRQTIGETYNEWSSAHYEKISHKKATAYAAAWKCCAPIQDLYWDEISTFILQKCVDSAKNTHYQRKTVRTVLNSIEAHAIRNGQTDRQLAKYLEIPSAIKPHKRPFTREEIDRVWQQYPSDPYAGAVLIMIYTGMRFGELSGMRPENIYLDDGYMLGGSKTELGRTGEILIVDKIKPLVKELMLPENRFHVSSTAFRKHFDNIDGCQGHTPHECRHSTATFLAEENIPPATISAIMRHTNYEQTLEYTHVSRQSMIEALSTALC